MRRNEPSAAPDIQLGAGARGIGIRPGRARRFARGSRAAGRPIAWPRGAAGRRGLCPRCSSCASWHGFRDPASMRRGTPGARNTARRLVRRAPRAWTPGPGGISLRPSSSAPHRRCDRSRLPTGTRPSPAGRALGAGRAPDSMPAGIPDTPGIGGCRSPEHRTAEPGRARATAGPRRDCTAATDGVAARCRRRTIRGMDTWKFYGITHADHVVCNPTSSERLDELIGLLDLPPGAAVWEAACGKGELLVRLAERHRIRGTGVDISPYEIVVARERAAARVPAAELTFIEGDAAAHPPEPASVDLAVCLGASWIWGGHRGTLQALRRFAKPGGLVLVGEPYWRREPEPGVPGGSRAGGRRPLDAPRQRRDRRGGGPDAPLRSPQPRRGLGPLRAPPGPRGRAVRPRPPRRPRRRRAADPSPPRRRCVPALGPRHPRLVDLPLPGARLTSRPEALGEREDPGVRHESRRGGRSGRQARGSSSSSVRPLTASSQVQASRSGGS